MNINLRSFHRPIVKLFPFPHPRLTLSTMSPSKSLPHTGRSKRPLETDIQTITPQVKRVKIEQPTYMTSLPNELVELIFLYLPPRVILRCLRVCKSFQSVISGSPLIRAMLHLSPISMNPNGTQKINPFLNRIFPDLPERREKSTFKFDDLVSGSHLVKPIHYYATTEGASAIKQSRTDKNASWKKMSLGTPGQPIRIRFVRAFEMPDGHFSTSEWKFYCREGLTMPEFREIYEMHKASQWGRPGRSNRLTWEFLCEDKTLWMKDNAEEEDHYLNKVKQRCGDISSWQDDIRIWYMDRVPCMGFIYTTWNPFEDIDSDDYFEDE
ncbi:hypothetical protein K469DRAFT_154166 [Zopfia rhizophila CBS 207.26]|uniref:F-box domain-containing protein n=1 Tax=Zopfia rhizophila CBS 207.26 TaxID=1314779 RepID=A0A6A6D5A9_9PEZI|nr:hypothetical protein K469DRAFT_154166 [Zopfia rhizophila CBS 207.26]